MDFLLTHAEIDPAALESTLRNEGAGACVTFQGRVRNLNEGKEVTALDYEAYAPLALKEGQRIMDEARGKFAIIGALCAHRTGSLMLGDIAICVAVTAAHRGAAFEACRYIVDEAKARVPIWKKEHYADGGAQWVNCATRAVAADEGRPGKN
jgi:molybdopterin synthase catalytic subunit